MRKRAINSLGSDNGYVFESIDHIHSKKIKAKIRKVVKRATHKAERRSWEE